MSKKQTVLVKKSAVAVVTASVVNRNLNLDAWDEFCAEKRLPLILVREGRIGLQRGVPIDVVKRAITGKLVAKRSEIEADDAERRRAQEKAEMAKKAQAEKAKAEIEEWERLASLSDQLEKAESKEERVKILAQISGKKSTTRKTSIPRDSKSNGEPTIIERIHALLPAKRSEIVNALSDLKSSYVNHYLSSYSGNGHAANGKNAIQVNRVSDKASPDDLFYL